MTQIIESTRRDFLGQIARRILGGCVVGPAFLNAASSCFAEGEPAVRSRIVEDATPAERAFGPLLINLRSFGVATGRSDAILGLLSGQSRAFDGIEVSARSLQAEAGKPTAEDALRPFHERIRSSQPSAFISLILDGIPMNSGANEIHRYLTEWGETIKKFPVNCVTVRCNVSRVPGDDGSIHKFAKHIEGLLAPFAEQKAPLGLEHGVLGSALEARTFGGMMRHISADLQWGIVLNVADVRYQFDLAARDLVEAVKDTDVGLRGVRVTIADDPSWGSILPRDAQQHLYKRGFSELQKLVNRSGNRDGQRAFLSMQVSPSLRESGKGWERFLDESSKEFRGLIARNG